MRLFDKRNSTGICRSTGRRNKLELKQLSHICESSTLSPMLCCLTLPCFSLLCSVFNALLLNSVLLFFALLCFASLCFAPAVTSSMLCWLTTSHWASAKQSSVHPIIPDICHFFYTDKYPWQISSVHPIAKPDICPKLYRSQVQVESYREHAAFKAAEHNLKKEQNSWFIH